MFKTKRITIKIFANLSGKLNAAEPGVLRVPLCARPLENTKDVKLLLLDNLWQWSHVSIKLCHFGPDSYQCHADLLQ